MAHSLFKTHLPERRSIKSKKRKEDIPRARIWSADELSEIEEGRGWFLVKRREKQGKVKAGLT